MRIAQEHLTETCLRNLDVLVPDDLLEDVPRRVPLVLEAELERADVVHRGPRHGPPPDPYPVDALDRGGPGSGGILHGAPAAPFLRGDRRSRLGVRARRRRDLPHLRVLHGNTTHPHGPHDSRNLTELEIAAGTG